MASKRFKKILAVRFFAYFSILLGVATLLAEFGPVGWAEANYRVNNLFGVKHVLDSSTPGSNVVTSAGVEQSSEGFEGVAGISDQKIIPVSTEYGIVIEKINANAKVIPNVNPAIERDYMAALAQGVAEAQGSTKPGENGNLYIFSHSTDAPWNIVRFNAVFYLLRELNEGDRITLFYQNRRYDYIVFNKTVARGDDISFLLNRYDKPVLTLQTCDPPGTILNRMVVRAKLAGT